MRRHNSPAQKANDSIQTSDLKNLSKKKSVDVNILLNRVKLNEKNKKKENLIILFSVILLISVTGIFTIF
jgi:hypothetical protein